MNSIETAVSDVKKGKIESYEIIIDEYQQRLFKYCYHMLFNYQDAEDALQEIFIKAFNKVNSYNEKTSFNSWIYKISYNHCINVIKRKRLITFLPFLDEVIDAKKEVEFCDFDNNIALHQSLRKLSFTERTIIINRVLDGQSFEEIAITLGIKTATVRKKYERIRKKLIGFISCKETLPSEALLNKLS